MSPFKLSSQTTFALALLALAFTPACSRGGKAPEKATVDAGSDRGWRRVVVTGGSNTEALFALGLGDRIIGVDTSSQYPTAETAKLPKIGYHRALSAEGILSLKPDVVLVSTEAGPPTALAQVRSAGITVEVIATEPTIAGAQGRLRHLARLFGKEAKGEELITGMNADLAAAAKLVAARTTRPRVLAVYARGANTVMAAGAKTPASAMIELAGGENVATYEGFKAIVAESIVASNPVLVLATTNGLTSVGGADGLFALPGLALTSAGKQKRMVVLDDLLLFGFGPRLGHAVLQLATAFGERAAGGSL